MADDKKSRIQLAGSPQAEEYIGTHTIEDSGALTLTRADGSTVTFGPGQWTSVEGDQTSSGGGSTPDATAGTVAGGSGTESLSGASSASKK